MQTTRILLANTTYAYYLRMYDHNIRKTLANMHIAQGARLFIYFLRSAYARSFFARAGLGARRVGLRVHSDSTISYVCS